MARQPVIELYVARSMLILTSNSTYKLVLGFTESQVGYMLIVYAIVRQANQLRLSRRMMTDVGIDYTKHGREEPDEFLEFYSSSSRNVADLYQHSLQTCLSTLLIYIYF